jgi:4-hydroxy-tetrahydrodipicolinate synthase
MQSNQPFDLTNYPLWTALITPFTETGEVDYEDLLGLLKIQEAANNGILILGSTGEALNIDPDTKRDIVEFCCAQELGVPLMVGVGGTMLAKTTQWIEWLNEQPVHSLLLVTPLYAKPGHRGQTAWFKTLLDAAQMPCILYNIPGRTSVPLHQDTVSDVLHHENFFGIKEASGDLDTFKTFCRNAPGKIMYSGDDGLMPEFARAGAHGLISVASNAWPDATHLMVEQTLSGTFTDVRLWKKATNALMSVTNPIPVKCLLHDTDVIKSPYLQLPLHADDLDDLEPIRQQNQAINDWYLQQTFAQQIS